MKSILLLALILFLTPTSAAFVAEEYIYVRSMNSESEGYDFFISATRSTLIKHVKNDNWDSAKTLVDDFPPLTGDKIWLLPGELFLIEFMNSDESFLADVENYTTYLELIADTLLPFDQVKIPLHTSYMLFSPTESELLNILINKSRKRISDFRFKNNSQSDLNDFLTIIFPFQYDIATILSQSLEFIKKYPNSPYVNLIYNHFIFYGEWGRSGIIWGGTFGLSIPTSKVKDDIKTHFVISIPFDFLFKGINLKLNYGMKTGTIRNLYDNSGALLDTDVSFGDNSFGIGSGYTFELGHRVFGTPYITANFSKLSLYETTADNLNIDEVLSKQWYMKAGFSLDVLVYPWKNSSYDAYTSGINVNIRFDIAYDNYNYNFLNSGDHRGSWVIGIGFGMVGQTNRMLIPGDSQ